MGAAQGTPGRERATSLDADGSVCAWDAVVVCGTDAAISSAMADHLRERQSQGRLLKGCAVAAVGDNTAWGAACAPPRAPPIMMALRELEGLLDTRKPYRALVVMVRDLPHLLLPSAAPVPTADEDTLVTWLDFCVHTLAPAQVGEPTPGVWVCDSEALLVEPAAIDWPPTPDCVVFLAQSGDADAAGLRGLGRATYDAQTSRVERVEAADGAGLVAALVHLSAEACAALLERARDNDALGLVRDVLPALTPQGPHGGPLAGLGDSFRLFARDTTEGSGRRAWLYTARSAAALRALLTEPPPPLLEYLAARGYQLEPQRPPHAPEAQSAVRASHRDDVPPGRYSRTGSVDSASSRGSRVRSRSRSMLDEGNVEVASTGKVYNSLLLGSGVVGERAVLCNCKLTGQWHIGAGAVCLGLRSSFARDVVVPPGMLVQETALLEASVIVAYGVEDALDAPLVTGTFAGLPWADVFARTGLKAAELWPVEGPRSLRTARLYPFGADAALTMDLAQHYLWEVLVRLPAPGKVPPSVMYVARQAWRAARRLSLADLEALRDAQAEMAWKAHLEYRIDEFALVGWLLEGRQADSARDALLSRVARRGERRLLATLQALSHRDTLPAETRDRAASCLAAARAAFEADADSSAAAAAAAAAAR